MDENTKTLTIDPETLVLMDVPCYETHSRGKNWMAAINRDPAKPSGLERSFFPTARGGGYYRLNQEIAPVPFAVEFGADYYSGRGKATRTRVYGVVTEIRVDALVLEITDTAAQACKRVKGLRDAVESTSVMDDQRQAEAFGDISSQDMLDELVRRGMLTRSEISSGDCPTTVTYHDSFLAPLVFRLQRGENF